MKHPKEYCVQICLFNGSGWNELGGVLSSKKLAIRWRDLIARHTKLYGIRIMERPVIQPWEEAKLRRMT